MFRITKAYKQGRGVLFYDLTDEVEHSVIEKVHKDEVVKLCEDGQVYNTKIQWWEGKPIVRIGDKNIPIIRVDEAGAFIGNVAPVTRNHSNSLNKSNEDAKTIDISAKAKVVGKLSNKKPKNNITYHGYDTKYVVEQQELSSTIDYSKYNTLGDLFVGMVKDYGLKDGVAYLEQFAKKVDLNKEIKGMNKSILLSIQNSINIYLMNMASKEMNDTFLKYNIR